MSLERVHVFMRTINNEAGKVCGYSWCALDYITGENLAGGNCFTWNMAAKAATAFKTKYEADYREAAQLVTRLLEEVRQ